MNLTLDLRSKINRQRVNAIVTNAQRQVIYGSMLGDGGTSWDSRPESNESFKEVHNRNQSEYLIWKSEYFNNWGVHFAQARNEYGFYTSACRLFKIIGHKFYLRENGKYILKWNGWRNQRVKILPDIALDVIGSKKNEGLGLAVWYMDDGSYLNKVYQDNGYGKRHKNLYIATDSFNKEENYKIRDWFWDRWHIDARVNAHNCHFVIHIIVSDIPKFFKIVRPYIKSIRCMKYKLGVKNLE